jgi:hypothetical protein
MNTTHLHPISLTSLVTPTATQNPAKRRRLDAIAPLDNGPLDNGTGGSDDVPHGSDDRDAVFIDINNIIYNDNPQKPWDPSRPPATLDLTEPLPNEELYPDGKRYAGQGPVQFTAFQHECLRGNRLFDSRPRTKAQQVTYLLSVYKNMAAKMIHLAIEMQPDRALSVNTSCSHNHSRIDDILANRSMFIRTDHIPWNIFTLRARSTVLEPPVLQIGFTFSDIYNAPHDTATDLHDVDDASSDIVENTSQDPFRLPDDIRLLRSIPYKGLWPERKRHFNPNVSGRIDN